MFSALPCCHIPPHHHGNWLYGAIVQISASSTPAEEMMVLSVFTSELKVTITNLNEQTSVVRFQIQTEYLRDHVVSQVSLVS